MYCINISNIMITPTQVLDLSLDLQSHMALNLNATAFTFSTGLAKNSQQGWLIDFLCEG